MRIAVVTPEFMSWGGVGSYVVQLAKNLPSDFEVHVISLDRKKMDDASSNLDGRIMFHGLGTAKDTFVYNNQFQINLWRKFGELQSEHHFDLLHANHAQMSDIMLKLLGMDIASVTTVHTTIGSQRMGTKRSMLPLRSLERSEKMTYLLLPFLSAAERIYMKRCTSVIFVSEFIRQWCEDSFDLECRSQVIHNGIDTDMFRPRAPEECLRHFPGLAGVDNIVLFSGRMIALKGLATAIQAAADSKNVGKAHFVFAGPGDPEQWKRMAQESGVPSSRCLFLPPVPYEEMPYLYPLASAFILPSYSESFPMTILEAMASGTPVIASSVGGVPEMITDGKDGLLVPPRDPSSLSEAIGSILDDHRLARSMCMRAREKVSEEFSARLMAKRTSEVYKTTLEECS